MVSVKSFIPAIAAVVVSTAALAADLPPPPPVAYQPPPPPVVEASGWYLRGDVGVGIQNFKNFDHDQTNPAFVWPASWTINQQEIKDATILGFGVGYEFNSWLRFDITGEYRTKVVGKATGSFKEFCAGGGTCFDSFDFDHSAAVFMANAYIDLGTCGASPPTSAAASAVRSSASPVLPMSVTTPTALGALVLRPVIRGPGASPGTFRPA
jgi:opacity protein-like surface antigen